MGLITNLYSVNEVVNKTIKRNDKRIVYHYTSPFGLINILKSHSEPGEDSNFSIRFTDCEYMNDKSEYIQIHSILKQVKELLDVGQSEFYSIIEEHYELCGDYSPYRIPINTTEYLFSKYRNYLFCCSTQPDSLNMWNYYIKDSNYQGYNIGFNTKGFINSLQDVIADKDIVLSYGQVIYDDEVKIEIIKQIIEENYSKMILHVSETKDPSVNKKSMSIKYGADFINEIEKIRIFFKDISFKSENEYRFVISIPEDCKSNLEIDFHENKGIITPSCTIQFNSNKCIKKVMIGPLLEQELGKRGLRSFLNFNGYDSKLEIGTSKIPIRY